MYNNVLQGIENIAIWPVISFVIFFLFFICLIWYVITVDPKFIQQMKNMPMNDSSKQKPPVTRKNTEAKVSDIRG